MNKKLITSSGTIFDIQRMSVNDGPGIRTTVFFQGCSLNCIWCHNPESITRERRVIWNSGKCSDCLKCIDVCNFGAHYVKNNSHLFNQKKCTLCENCLTVCQSAALTIGGKDLTVEDTINEIKKDIPYYKSSNGGVTLSGGEPLLQKYFATSLLKELHEMNINSCIDTCGQVSRDSFEMALPFTNTFLFDYKATDSAVHKKLTGAGNELILSNLDFLLSNNADIILRCPLIPDKNDNNEHLKSIANFVKYPSIKEINIMPYHDTGKKKQEDLGRIFDFKKVDNKILLHWKKTLGNNKKIVFK